MDEPPFTHIVSACPRRMEPRHLGAARGRPSLSRRADCSKGNFGETEEPKRRPSISTTQATCVDDGFTVARVVGKSPGGVVTATDRSRVAAQVARRRGRWAIAALLGELCPSRRFGWPRHRSGGSRDRAGRRCRWLRGRRRLRRPFRWLPSTALTPGRRLRRWPPRWWRGPMWWLSSRRLGAWERSVLRRGSAGSPA